MNPTENGTSFFIHYFSSVISQLISRAENIPQLETFSGHSPSYLPFYYVFRKFWLTSWAWNAEIYQNKEHRAQNILFSAEKKLKWNVDQSLSAEKWNSGISWQRHEFINLQLLFFIPKLGPINHVNVQLVARRLRITAKRPFMIPSNSSRIPNPFCMFSIKTQSPKV